MDDFLGGSDGIPQHTGGASQAALDAFFDLFDLVGDGPGQAVEAA